MAIKKHLTIPLPSTWHRLKWLLPAASVGFFLGGCGVPAETEAEPAAVAALSSPGISPVIDWSMPAVINLDPLMASSASSASATRFPVILDACASQSFQVGRLNRFEWSSSDFRLAGILPITSSGCKSETLMLKEGTYSVSLRVSSDRGASASVTANLVVKNVLIVSMGDSIASGEGSPHLPAQRGGEPARWLDRRCHRSLRAGPARAAQALEDADPRSSVTFVSVACSGSSIFEGLLEPYAGQELTAAESRGPKLSPQIERVQKLVCPQGCSADSPQIDALLLSIGANDIKFADIVRDCAIPGPIARCNSPRNAQLVAARFPVLPNRYAALNAAIREQLRPQAVFITEYQDPTWDDRAANGQVRSCDEMVFRDGGPGSIDGVIDADEIVWAREKVVRPLNDAVANAARAHDWRLVPVQTEFVGHGYCADNRWIVRYDESFRNQLTQDGSMHPNPEGHLAYGRKLAAEVSAELAKRGDAGITPEPGLMLAQSTSGLCIHPNGGSNVPDNGTDAVLYPDCGSQPRLQYRMLTNGAIQHISSGKCLHPSGGAVNPGDGTNVVFWDGCDDDRLAFEVTPAGSLRHKTSGLCIHPQGGSATPEALTKLVLANGCDEPRLRFEGRVPDGRLAHSGGSCVHPEGGLSNSPNFTRLVMWNDCRNDPSRVFKLRGDGNIEHIASGKCLHLRGGSSTPENGTDLILFGVCGESRLSFRVTPAGSIQHISSGKCIHPAGGSAFPNNGTHLVLWDGCNMNRTAFSPVTQL